MPKPQQHPVTSNNKPDQDSRIGSSTSKMRYEKSYETRSRETRQTSEPRVAATNFPNNHESSKNNFINTDRNRDMTRDTRSVEPVGASNYDRNKPPSGQQRISNSLINRLPAKVDQLAPRFKKKLLMEIGLPLELLDKNISELTNQQQFSSSWSNTLPAGGRGRNNHRYDNSQPQKYHMQQNQYPNHHYQTKYNQNYHDYDNNYRSLTPPPSVRIQQHQQQHQQKHHHQQQQQQQQHQHQNHQNNHHQQQQQHPHHHNHHLQQQRYDYKPNNTTQNDEFTLGKKHSLSPNVKDDISFVSVT